jgi:8-oxo-dGTP pyrophosphatase MutT (NUDIX family)
LDFNENSKYNQSGVIPYRFRNNEIEVLLITSRKKKRWIIPKGIIEKDLSPAESAKKEAFEEAGIAGKIKLDSVGKYQYKKWGGTCTVKLFLLEVEKIYDNWPESDVRDRRWLTTKDAINLIEVSILKKLFSKLSVLVK